MKSKVVPRRKRRPYHLTNEQMIGAEVVPYQTSQLLFLLWSRVFCGSLIANHSGDAQGCHTEKAVRGSLTGAGFHVGALRLGRVRDLWTLQRTDVVVRLKRVERSRSILQTLEDQQRCNSVHAPNLVPLYIYIAANCIYKCMSIYLTIYILLLSVHSTSCSSLSLWTLNCTRYTVHSCRTDKS